VHVAQTDARDPVPPGAVLRAAELRVRARPGLISAAGSRLDDGVVGELALVAFAIGSFAVSLWSGTGRLRRNAAWRYVAGCGADAGVVPVFLVVPSLAGMLRWQRCRRT
jgi:hypothetical protein